MVREGGPLLPLCDFALSSSEEESDFWIPLSGCCHRVQFPLFLADPGHEELGLQGNRLEEDRDTSDSEGDSEMLRASDVDLSLPLVGGCARG